MSTVTLRFCSTNRRLQESLFQCIYVQKNLGFFHCTLFFFKLFISCFVSDSLLFVKYMNYSLSRIALHSYWVMLGKKRDGFIWSISVRINMRIAGILFQLHGSALYFSNSLTFDCCFEEVYIINYSSHHSGFYRPFSAYLSHLTFHAWISFHLSKPAVSQNTPCLGGDKRINSAHICLISYASPILWSITYLPSWWSFYSIKPFYLSELYIQVYIKQIDLIFKPVIKVQSYP